MLRELAHLYDVEAEHHHNVGNDDEATYLLNAALDLEVDAFKAEGNWPNGREGCAA